MITAKVKDQLQLVGEITELFKEFFRCLYTGPFYLGRIYEQVVHLGIGSLPITLVIGTVTGMVMTLQFGYGLEKFGGTLYVPAIVALSLLRKNFRLALYFSLDSGADWVRN